MGTNKPALPADLEMKILGFLWEGVPLNLLEIHAKCEALRSVSKGTVATTLHGMVTKGLLVVVEPDRPQKYAAAVDRESINRVAISHVTEKNFGGSAKAFAIQALGALNLSPVDRAKIERIIRKAEGRL